MRGLRHWSYLLKNTPEKCPVLVFTDHANLQYYRDPKRLPAQVHSWNAERADYNMKFIYKPGATNHADGLSRRPDHMAGLQENPDVLTFTQEMFNLDTTERQTSIATTTLGWSGVTGEEILRGQGQDVPDTIELDYQAIKTQHDNQNTLQRWQLAHGLEERSNCLWKGPALVIVGNDDLKSGVITLFHDSPTAGHPGIAKTTETLAQHYWWPGMRNQVTEYIKGCATCQMTKVNTNPSKPAIFPITSEPNPLPFQTIAMDLITDLPVSDGYDTILTITDHDCSKAAIFIPCNKTIDAEGVAAAYATHVTPHYGIPQKIISDRDPQFTAKFSTELCKILGIKQNLSTAFHPQTDGQSERTNQSLEQYLRIFCSQDQHEWAKWLPLAQYTRNSWLSSTTKKTPFDLIMGYTPVVHQPIRKAELPSIGECISKITENRNAAQEALRKAQEHLSKITKFKAYKENDKVWLEATHLKVPYESAKLSPKRYGPFRVAAVISPVAYRLELPPTWKIHPVFHASLMTPYRETETHGPNFLEPPPVEIDGGEPEWEIESILKDRTYRKKKQFLVRWKDYSPAHDSWVNESDLHADELLQDYVTAQSAARRTSAATSLRTINTR